MNLPAELPSYHKAKLPQSYAKAKLALEQCERVDECKSWSDKAVALASYARQAHDDELMKVATRIQSRALRRCGQLLKALAPDEKGGNPNRNGTVTVTRNRAAEDAGLSTRQKRTALRVANVPEGEFEEAVESEDPPTATELAERGTNKVEPILDLKGIDPELFANATKVQGAIESLARLLKTQDPVRVAAGLYEDEEAPLLETIIEISKWLNRLIAELGLERKSVP